MHGKRGTQRIWFWALAGFAAVLAYLYFFGGHKPHLDPYLPFAFLLGMVAMHLMPGMHGGHRGDNEHKHAEDDEQKK